MPDTPSEAKRLKYAGFQDIPDGPSGNRKTSNVVDGDYRDSDGRSITFWDQNFEALPYNT